MLTAFAESATDGAVSRPFILNVKNGQTAPWLPLEAIIETPVLVQHGRAKALAVADAPPEVKALVQSNCTYEMLAVEAIVERDRDKAACALLLNPMGISYDQAKAVVERAWSHG